MVKAGFKAIVVTVDAPVAGKRERDERTKLDLEAVSFFPFSATIEKPVSQFTILLLEYSD